MTEQTDQETATELLLARIKGAFPQSVFLGPVTGADGLPNEELDEEQALYGALHGRRWSEILASFIESHPDGFVLLTDEAFGAFLPAWLICALTHEKVRELVVYVFSPGVHKSMERTDLRIRRLTPTQREALREFLAYSAHVDSSPYVKEHALSALTHVASLE